MTKAMMKEDVDPKSRRQQSSNEEYDAKWRRKSSNDEHRATTTINRQGGNYKWGWQRRRETAREKRRKSIHVASCLSRCVARTFDVVQFYDEGLIVPYD